jgi:hypothetical protein
MNRLMFFILASVVATSTCSNAQSCFKRTHDFAYGEYFVKATSDSTCFGQWLDTLYYYNVNTGVPLFRLCINDYIPNRIIPFPSIKDVLLYDSVLVLRWSEYIRVVKLGADGSVTEHPSCIDSLPLIKNGLLGWPILTPSVKQSFVLARNKTLYVFQYSNRTIECKDSMQLRNLLGQSRPFDVQADTVILLTAGDSLLYYLIDGDMKFTYSHCMLINKRITADRIYCHNGNIYAEYFPELIALIRNGDQFIKGESVWVPGYENRLCRGINNLSIVSEIGNIYLYDADLHLICRMPAESSHDVISYSFYGEKIFMASASDGIRTYIPDSVTNSVQTMSSARESIRMEISPNPIAGGKLTVQISDSDVILKLTNALGHIVYSMDHCSTNRMAIDIQGLPKGVYYVTAQTKVGTIAKSVIIQ